MEVEGHPSQTEAEGDFYRSVIEDFAAKCQNRCPDLTFLTGPVLFRFTQFVQRKSDVFLPKWQSRVSQFLCILNFLLTLLLDTPMGK